MSMNINAKQAELLKNYYLEGNTKGTSAKEIKELEAKYGKDNIKMFIANLQKNASVDNNEYEFEDDKEMSSSAKNGDNLGLSYQMDKAKSARGWKIAGLVGSGAGVAAAVIGAFAFSNPVGWVIGIGIGLAVVGGIIAGSNAAAETEANDKIEELTEQETPRQPDHVVDNNVDIDVNQEVNIQFDQLNSLLAQILEKLNNIDNNTANLTADLAQIKALLQSIGVNVSELNETQRAMYDFLMENFDKLCQLVQEGNGLATEILVNVQAYGNQNNEDNKVIIELLGKISGQLDNLDANQQNSFNLILQGIRGLNSHDYRAQLEAILAELVDINGNITETGAAILDKMDQTIDAVDRNGEKMDQMNLTLNEILNKIKAGNVTFDEISAYLQAIQNNTGNAAVDLALIRNLLGQILDNEIQQNNVLNNIDGQYAQILEDIYNKIPEMMNSGNTTNINVEVNLLIVYLLEIFSGTEQGQNANEGQAQDEFNWLFNREENPDMPQGGALARYNELIAGGMSEQDAIRQLLRELFGGTQEDE